MAGDTWVSSGFISVAGCDTDHFLRRNSIGPPLLCVHLLHLFLKECSSNPVDKANQNYRSSPFFCYGGIDAPSSCYLFGRTPKQPHMKQHAISITMIVTAAAGVLLKSPTS